MLYESLLFLVCQSPTVIPTTVDSTPTVDPLQSLAAVEAATKESDKADIGTRSHLRLGRFTYSLIGGIQVSQDSGDFSEINPYIHFTGDTTWRPEVIWPNGGGEALPREANDVVHDWSDIHTSFDLTLGSVAAIVEGEDAPSGEEFLRSKKAVSLTLGFEDRFLRMPWSYSRVDDQATASVLFLGPLLRGGFHTLTEDAAEDEQIDTVNSWVAAGVRIGSYNLTKGDVNPPLLRHVDLTYGYHENYDGNRLMIDALLRTDEQTGFFIATRAVVGPGQDDVRLMAGFALNLQGVQSAVGGLANMFGGGR